MAEKEDNFDEFWRVFRLEQVQGANKAQCLYHFIKFTEIISQETAQMAPGTDLTSSEGLFTKLKHRFDQQFIQKLESLVQKPPTEKTFDEFFKTLLLVLIWENKQGRVSQTLPSLFLEDIYDALPVTELSPFIRFIDTVIVRFFGVNQPFQKH